MPFVRSRVNRVLMLGAAGMAVTMMYLLYQAPDLVLTQLMFELISIMLFLLVLRMLPEEPKTQPKGGRLGRAAIGGTVGLVIGFLVLHAAETPDFNPGVRLGDWFVAHSYDGLADTEGRGGGGLNVVNVILVDHRGYDTLGEITVLGIVALAVLSLIGSAPAKKLRAMVTRGLDYSPDQFHPDDPKAVNIGPQPTLQSSLFEVAMRLILPLALIFAGYVFFKGHNAPGGGFIAGLTASVALAVFRMASGPDALKKLIPVKPAPMAAIGLGIALLSAAWPMAIGDPFLRSYHDVVELPGGGSYHWASVMLFDLGVLTVVVAASVGIINRLTEEVET
jgi:multisubunit Na+/H+ antiporter MnhB subunit